jgi:hypothetical protein
MISEMISLIIACEWGALYSATAVRHRLSHVLVDT